MQHQDRRVKRTQRLLAQALIDLTLSKGYEAVTIREITDQADVGYATFFRHYPDKDALLADVLDVVMDDLLELLQPGPADTRRTGSLLFGYVAEHSAVCQVLLSSRGSAGLIERVIERGTRNVLRTHAPRASSAVPAEVAAHHLITSSVALIEWWLARGMPYPPERMGEIYQSLILGPTLAVAFEGIG